MAGVYKPVQVMGMGGHSDRQGLENSNPRKTCTRSRGLTGFQGFQIGKFIIRNYH